MEEAFGEDSVRGVGEEEAQVSRGEAVTQRGAERVAGQASSLQARERRWRLPQPSPPPLAEVGVGFGGARSGRGGGRGDIGDISARDCSLTAL